jgi:hypothetical protein
VKVPAFLKNATQQQLTPEQKPKPEVKGFSMAAASTRLFPENNRSNEKPPAPLSPPPLFDRPPLSPSDSYSVRPGLVQQTILYGRERLQEQFTKGQIAENPFLEAASLVASQFTGTLIASELNMKEESLEQQKSETESQLTFQQWLEGIFKIQHFLGKFLKKPGVSPAIQPVNKKQAEDQTQHNSADTAALPSPLINPTAPKQPVGMVHFFTGSFFLRPIVLLLKRFQAFQKRIQSFWRYIRAYDYQQATLQEHYYKGLPETGSLPEKRLLA